MWIKQQEIKRDKLSILIRKALDAQLGLHCKQSIQVVKCNDNCELIAFSIKRIGNC